MNWGNAASTEHRLSASSREHSAAATPKPLAVIEIRSYNLKPGKRDEFHRLFVERSLPLLQQFHVDVVAYGPSLHDADSYFLMRAYRSLEDRDRSENEFYGNDAWKKGPREAILADIESYTTIVLPADERTLDSLRRLKRP